MKSHGITMIGEFIVEKVDSLPTFDATRDRGRLLYNSSDSKWYIGSESSWSAIEADDATLNDHENRITTNENDISDINTTLDSHNSRITTNESDISTTNTTLNDHIGSTDEHPTATPTEDGFMSNSDKDKLDNINIDPAPTGTIIMHSDSTVPDGYLECYGNEISRSTYSNLFDVIGTRYGSGNGSTTFNLPTLGGYYVRGWDHGRGADNNRSLGSEQGSTMRSHTHGYRDRYFMEIAPRGHRAITGWDYIPGGPYHGCGDTDHDNDFLAYLLTYTELAGDAGSYTEPQNVSLMFIIKY